MFFMSGHEFSFKYLALIQLEVRRTIKITTKEDKEAKRVFFNQQEHASTSM